MIEELKQILEIVKDLPHMVMWVLVGLLLYKIVYIGSIFGLIRLMILKLYDGYIAKEKKPEVVLHKVDKLFITHDGTYDRFLSLISSLRHRKGRGFESDYIHAQDVTFLENLFKKDQE